MTKPTTVDAYLTGFDGETRQRLERLRALITTAAPEAQESINSESLNAEAAKRYITASLKREFASDSGTELNAVLPKMSPLNPQYLTKKQNVFQKIAAFVEKFKGVGGQV